MTYFEYEPEFLVDDPGFLRLKPEAAYLFTLLSHRSMRHGPLVPDRAFYKHLWGSRFHSFERAWRACQEVAEVSPDGCWRFAWVEDMRDEMLARLRSDKERKKKSRLAARDKGLSGGRPEDVTGTSLRAGAPTDGRTDGRAGVRENGDVPDKPEPAAAPQDSPASPKKPRKPATGPHADLIRFWSSEWARTRGGASWAFKQAEGVAIDAMLKEAKGDVAEVQRRITASLEDADPWIQKALVGPRVLWSQWNRYATTSTPIARKAKDRKADIDRRAEEAAVERAWMAKHATLIEVPGPGGTKINAPGVDGKYPGFEAAKLELSRNGTH